MTAQGKQPEMGQVWETLDDKTCENTVASEDQVIELNV